MNTGEIAPNNSLASRTLSVDTSYGPHVTWTSAKSSHTRGDVAVLRPGVHLAGFVSKSYAATISGCVRASSVTTVTTSAAHGFVAGDRVRLHSTATAAIDFDNEYRIFTVPSSTTFTVRQYGSDETVGAGGYALGLCEINAHGALVYWDTSTDPDNLPEILSDGTGSLGTTAPTWLVVRGGSWIMSTISGALPGQAMGAADTSYFDLDIDTLRTDDASESGTISGGATVIIRAKDITCDGYAGFVAIGGRKLVMRADRLSAASAAALSIEDGLPTAFIDVTEIVGGIQTASGDSGDECTVRAMTITGKGSVAQGGGLNLSGNANFRASVAGRIASTNGPAIRIADSGGYRQVLCSYIKSTYNNAAGVAVDLSPVTNGAEVLTLGPGLLVSHSTATVGIKGPATGSVKLRLLGDVYSNKPIGANITIVGSGTYTEDATVA